MKAISEWQPYGSLIINGEKHIETRHWSTGYRGLLAIHAAKRWTGDEVMFCKDLKRRWDTAVQETLGRWPVEPLPLGAMLGIVRLKNVVPVENVLLMLEPFEIKVGNYGQGRYAWILEVVERFPEPIPAKGSQGLFDWKRP